MTLVSGKEVIETLTKEFEELLTNEHRVWQPVDYGYKWENVEVSIALQIHEESNSQIVKTKGIVNAPLSVVFEFLYDIQTMMTWDQYCQEIKIIEEYDDSHKIIYIKYIPDLPAQPREFVVFRYFFSKDLPEGKTIFIVYRSVNHPRIPVSSNRSELYTSGCELRSLPDEKTEVTIILNRNFNGNEDTPFCRQIQAKYVARIIPTLNRSLQIENSSDIKMQYLAKVEIRTLKEIADNFFNQTQWKPLIQENGVQVFAKPLEKDIISATGLYLVPVSPQSIYNFLLYNLGDPLSQLEDIEVIDESTFITRIVYTSFVVNKKCDAVVLRAGRITPDGVYISFLRSVVHSKIPPSDDHVRIEILPTCYFLHPVEGTKKCLISYYVQLKITSLQVALTADKYGITDIVQACAPILAKRVEAILLNVGALVSASSSERLRVSKEIQQNVTDEMTILKKRLYSEMQENSSLPNFTECVTKQKNVLTSLLGYQSSPFFVSRTAQQNTFSYSISSSVFQLFPNEIILSIANFLDCQSICRLGQTCRKMIFLLEEETLWKNLFKKYWNSLPRKENLYFNRWKLTFQKRYVLEKNWDHARCVLIPLTPQHNLAIRDIQIFESLAVTGSGDKSVKLWNLDTHQNIANFSGSAGVGGLYLTDSFLISGFNNGSVRKWNYLNNNWELEWEKQFAYLVEGFQFFPSHAVSWMNHDIDIWNFNTMVLDAKLTGHQKKVNCVLADPTNQVILSGSSDRTLKIWDLATGACTQTLIGHTAAINSISFCKDLISSGGNDKYIRIWDRRTNSQIDSFKISNNLLIPQGTYSSSVSFLTPKTLALSDSKVAVGSNDHLIRLYDCRKQYFPLKVLTPVLTSSSPNPSFNLSPVISLAINNRRILSGHSDGSLQDWYFDKYL